MRCWRRCATPCSLLTTDPEKPHAMYVKDLSTIRLTDLPDVGAKNASLGELQLLSDYDVVVPRGFVSTARAFGDFLEQNRLHAPLADLFSRLARPSYENLAAIGSAARTLLLKASLPEPFATDVLRAYHDLCRGSDLPVTVRSSAIAEGHPDAYFAGRLDSFLNISGEMAVLEAVQHCFASLFNDRAIKYREENSVAHEKTALSVCIQLMVRSDLGASGVAFSTDPDTGFRNAVQISGIWGLSENLAQGASAPDEFLVFKPALASGKQALLQKKLGVKAKTLTYGATPNTLINSDTPAIRRSLFVLDDATITRLARCCVAIEAHYGGPMEIEWASDGVSGQLFILQARPETVQQGDRPDLVTEFRLNKRGAPLTSGCAVGTRVATGTARLIASPDEGDRLQDGDILVTDLARPDWYPVLRRAAAIVTNKGGRSSHASIVARELGVPALVGCGNATDVIRDGDTITVSCCEGSAGNVYAGAVPHTIIEHDFSGMRMPRHTVPMVIASDPDGAFRLNRIPHGGVGLLRLEFLIAHEVKIHPMALARFELLEPGPVRAQVEALTARYPDKKEYFVDKVSQGIAVIAAAVYPRPVLVRMSDLKTNEYAGLIGGAAFEPEEENPMIGFRGASRYDHPAYRDGFALECAAVRRVRTDMG
ncbi:MAG: phosphoenolpyruvate synthase, partial [Myxococcales bacterium]